MLITTTKTLQLRIEIGPNGPQCVMSTFGGFPQRTMVTPKSVEQLSNWCLGCVYFMVFLPHNARHLYGGEMEMGFHHGSSSRSQYLPSSGQKNDGKKLIRNRLNHKIWNNPSFHSNLSYHSCFFSAFLEQFDQSKVPIYQCPKCRSLNSLTNIINLIKFKWKLENHTTVAVTHKAATHLNLQIRTWRSQEINISVDWHARPLRVKCDSVSSFVWHSLDVFKSESIPKQINDLICIHRITKNQKKKNEKRNENSCQM